MIKFRPLKAEEVEVRIGQVTAKGATFLLYKDARADMTLLDETVGAENWQRKHEIIDGNLYCSVGIYDETKKEWVWKQDVGTESNTEKEKGQASDSFKRACTNWGVGRELYTSPFIFFKTGTVQNDNGKGYKLANPYEFYGLYVKELESKNGKITLLVLNQKAQGQDVEVFRYE